MKIILSWIVVVLFMIANVVLAAPGKTRIVAALINLGALIAMLLAAVEISDRRDRR